MICIRWALDQPANSINLISCSNKKHVCISFLITMLYEIDTFSTDNSNVYLQAPARKNLAIVAGLSHIGQTVTHFRAKYGLKYSVPNIA